MKGPKLVAVFLLAEAQNTAHGEMSMLPAHSLMAGPGVGKLVLSLCHLWSFQVCVGITTSRMPRGLPAASTWRNTTWHFVTSPLGAGPSFWSSRAGF